MASLLQYPFCCQHSLKHSSALTQRDKSRAGALLPLYRNPRRFDGGPSWQPRKPILVEARTEEGPSGSRRGENLWRNELLTQDSSASSWSEDSLLQRAEEESELEQRQQAQRQKSRKSKEDENSASAMNLIGNVVEKLLVADFFFILFILAWFLAGLAEKAAFDTSTLIDAWLPLWSPVFQPALGFFMAAAVWSAVSKKWLKG